MRSFERQLKYGKATHKWLFHTKDGVVNPNHSLEEGHFDLC